MTKRKTRLEKRFIVSKNETLAFRELLSLKKAIRRLTISSGIEFIKHKQPMILS